MLCIAYTRSVGFQTTKKSGTINKACYNYIFICWVLTLISRLWKSKRRELQHVAWYSLILCLIFIKEISVQNRFVWRMTFQIFNKDKKTNFYSSTIDKKYHTYFIWLKKIDNVISVKWLRLVKDRTIYSNLDFLHTPNIIY